MFDTKTGPRNFNWHNVFYWNILQGLADTQQNEGKTVTNQNKSLI